MEMCQTLLGRIQRSMFFVISLWSNTVCWAKIPETEKEANNSALSMAFNIAHSTQSTQKFVNYARSAKEPNVGLSQKTILSAESRRSSKRHSCFYWTREPMENRRQRNSAKSKAFNIARSTQFISGLCIASVRPPRKAISLRPARKSTSLRPRRRCPARTSRVLDPDKRSIRGAIKRTRSSANLQRKSGRRWVI